MRVRYLDYPGDLDRITRFLPDLYETNFPGFMATPEFINRKRQQLRDAQRDPAQTILVAEDSGGVCGFIWLTVEIEYSGRRTGEVAAIYVTPGSRGGGVGKALMREAEEIFRISGVQRIILMVTQANQAALGLYEDLGFAVTRLQMEKELPTKKQP